MSTARELPEDVRAAILRSAKTWILTNWAGGQKELNAWSDHYASLCSIYSWSLPGRDLAKNRRRLAKLVHAGLLVEERRISGVRRFSAPREAVNEIGAQAIREWEAVGYVVGVKMDEIKDAKP